MADFRITIVGQMPVTNDALVAHTWLCKQPEYAALLNRLDGVSKIAVEKVEELTHGR